MQISYSSVFLVQAGNAGQRKGDDGEDQQQSGWRHEPNRRSGIALVVPNACQEKTEAA